MLARRYLFNSAREKNVRQLFTQNHYLCTINFLMCLCGPPERNQGEAVKFIHLIPLLLATAITGAHSQNAVTSFSAVKWSFGTTHFQYGGCNELVLDVIGDFQRGTSFVAPGVLNCTFGTASGSIAIVGSGYFGQSGAVTFRLKMGDGNQLFCDGLGPTLSGSCRLQNSSAGDIGFATVSLR